VSRSAERVFASVSGLRAVRESGPGRASSRRYHEERLSSEEHRTLMRKRADDNVDWARRTLLAAVAITPALGTRVAEAAAKASSGAVLPADLAKAVSAYDQATLHNDVATLSSLVADNYVLVNSDSTLQDKRSYLSDFARPGFRIEPYVIEQPVQKVWREAAVTGGLLRLGWTQDGKHQQRMVRIAHVWARSGTRWQIVYTQLTRVPEEKSQGSSQATPTMRDGQHDFDFEIGTWKTHLRRLVHPLSGSTSWVEYEGTTVVRKVWNGRANLVELEVDGPAGHIEALSLRLYNPETRQWSLNFSNSAGGTLGVPAVGEFENGRGEFFNPETLNGKAILVRFVISNITPRSCHFEQAFSDDGGKTWEVNWIANDTRAEDGRPSATPPH
jgi:ketosteroid isomerase-like protein